MYYITTTYIDCISNRNSKDVLITTNNNTVSKFKFIIIFELIGIT